MTECERIIKNNILPESFFKEETICDFLVTTERKKIWAVELDLLLEFDRVCKKHNLRYYLSYGTLLGAVRHNGFIPWDDDLDVEMPREDYEQLQKLPEAFKMPYFLQSPKTDEYYAYSHIRLRNNNTTCFSKIFAFQPMCHGMYIDIFPLDKWSEQDEANTKVIEKLNCDNSTFMRMTNPFLKEIDRARVYAYSKDTHIEDYLRINTIATKYKDIDVHYLITAVCSVYGFSRNLRPIEVYNKTNQMEFIGHKFPVPSGYNTLLSIYYGDYLKLPPISERGKWHESIVFEPDVPYKEYLVGYCQNLRNENRDN